MADSVADEREEDSRTMLDMLAQLDDRRRMETDQELYRIHTMNKVSQSLRAVKIARNLITKLNNGPIRDRTEEWTKPTRKSSVGRLLSEDEAMHGSRILNKLKASQDEELQAIREKRLVQAGKQDKDFKRRAHVLFKNMRLMNHRVYLTSPQEATSENAADHKSSILVTQSEVVPDKTEASHFIRQESLHVINNFFKIPSHSQRVLKRLNSEEVCSVSETLGTNSCIQHDGEVGGEDHEGVVKEGESRQRRGARRRKLAQKLKGSSAHRRNFRNGNVQDKDENKPSVPAEDQNKVKMEREESGGKRHHHHRHHRRKKHVKTKKGSPNGHNTLPKKIKRKTDYHHHEVLEENKLDGVQEEREEPIVVKSLASSEHTITQGQSKELPSDPSSPPPSVPTPPSPPRIQHVSAPAPPPLTLKGPPLPPTKASPPPSQVASPPGNSTLSPDHSTSPPDHLVSPPGRGISPPGHAESPPGQAKSPPGKLLNDPTSTTLQDIPSSAHHDLANGLPTGDVHSQDDDVTTPVQVFQDDFINTRESMLLVETEQLSTTELEVQVHEFYSQKQEDMEGEVQFSKTESVECEELTTVEVNGVHEDIETELTPVPPHRLLYIAGSRVESDSHEEFDTDFDDVAEDYQASDKEDEGRDEIDGNEEDLGTISKPHFNRYFSSPQLSVRIPSVEADHHSGGPSTNLLASSVQTNPTPSGYYTPMNVEVNPFSFSNEEPKKKKRVVADHDASATTEAVSTPREIPAQAFQNPRFVQYAKSLGREPRLEDYVTFTLCKIGDSIDRKYDTQLNQALDEAFMEIIKDKLSWGTFKAISKKLMFEGQHVQDGIFMIPCFGRRLMEAVPQWGGVINEYTHQVVNDYAADILLSLGGWSNLMESYNQVEVIKEDEEEEYPGLYEECAAMQYGLDIPPIIVEEDPSHLSPGPQRPPPIWVDTPLPYSATTLRRRVSVEVLFEESDSSDSELEYDPRYHTARKRSSTISMPRSLSTSSLDTLTPGTASSHGSSAGLFQYTITKRPKYERQTIDKVITVETLHEEQQYLSQQSRQTSISSTYSTTSVNVMGQRIEIVTRGGELHPLTPLSSPISSGEEMPDFFQSPIPSRSSSNEGSSMLGERQSLVLKIVVPAALALGAVALGYWYFTRKK